jgi:hypothetical protein
MFRRASRFSARFRLVSEPYKKQSRKNVLVPRIEQMTRVPERHFRYSPPSAACAAALLREQPSLRQKPTLQRLRDPPKCRAGHMSIPEDLALLKDYLLSKRYQTEIWIGSLRSKGRIFTEQELERKTIYFYFTPHEDFAARATSSPLHQSIQVYELQ